MNPKDLLFSESHEWIEASGDARHVGVSDHAQQMLGDIVYVEMPSVGDEVTQGEEFMTIESPKAAASVYAPLSGVVVEVNENLDAAPDTVNSSPYEGGWFVKIRPSDADGESGKLMNYDDYEKKVNEE